MAYLENLQFATKRISSLFSKKEKTQKSEGKAQTRQRYMRLNLLLLTTFLKNEKSITRVSPLFTAKIVSSKNKHLLEMTRQANSCCSSQDLHLFSYRQFYHRNELSLHRVIEWKLTKYIKSRAKLNGLIHKLKEAPPDAFKRHFVNLLTKEEIPVEDSPNQDDESQWKVWQSRGGGGGHPFSITPP